MRTILLTPNCSKGEKIAYLFCGEQGWIAISEKDKKEMFLQNEFVFSDHEDCQVITEEELLEIIPILRN